MYLVLLLAKKLCSLGRKFFFLQFICLSVIWHFQLVLIFFSQKNRIFTVSVFSFVIDMQEYVDYERISFLTGFKPITPGSRVLHYIYNVKLFLRLKCISYIHFVLKREITPLSSENFFFCTIRFLCT